MKRHDASLIKIILEATRSKKKKIVKKKLFLVTVIRRDTLESLTFLKF